MSRQGSDFRERGDLGSATVRMRLALDAVLDAVGSPQTARQASLRSQLEFQSAGLRRLEAAVRAGAVPRRVWALGQAATPVLPVLLGSVRAAGVVLPPAVVEELTSALEAFADALTRTAEGR